MFIYQLRIFLIIFWKSNAARDKLVELTNISLGTLLAIVQSGVEQAKIVVHNAQGAELYEHRG